MLDRLRAEQPPRVGAGCPSVEAGVQTVPNSAGGASSSEAAQVGSGGQGSN